MSMRSGSSGATRAERTTDSTRRSAGEVRSQSSVVGLVARDRSIIATCIGLISVLAWAYLIQLDRQMTSSAASETMMAKMGMTVDAPWGARDFIFTFAMWAV